MIAKIILADGTVCSDYKYSFNPKNRFIGGMSSFRKLRKYTYDDCVRDAAYMFSKRYGVEFVKLKFDSDGYVSGFRIDLKLLAKRKELAKKNVKKYLLEKNSRVMSWIITMGIAKYGSVFSITRIKQLLYFY